jgi:hypothetical protein
MRFINQDGRARTKTCSPLYSGYRSFDYAVRPHALTQHFVSLCVALSVVVDIAQVSAHVSALGEGLVANVT